MEKYINQLLADLEAAKQNVPPPINYEILYPHHPAIAFDLPHLVAFDLSGIPLPQLLGISLEQLPPVENLTNEQAEKLVAGILDLWKAFNIVADFPNSNIPIQLIYKVLREKWITTEIQYMPVGTWHVEFCSYDPTECHWGSEYCTCKDLLDNYKQNIDFPFEEGEDLPF